MQGDHNSNSYYHYPPEPNPTTNPNSNPPVVHHHHPYASAPPFSTTNYPPADHSPYPSQYPPYPQNPVLIPQSAPPYSHPNPNLHSFPAPPTLPSSSFPPYDHQTPYPPPVQQQSHYPPYDHHQTSPNYSDAHLGSSYPLIYENQFESNVKLGRAGSYPDEYSGGYGGGGGGYGRSRTDSGGVSRSDSGSFRDDGFGLGDRVYAYQGNKVEPYDARGTAPKSSTCSGFDDFGRPISFPSEKNQPKPAKIVRAVPKADTQQDEKGGVQKFRVKLLAESGAQSTMDVLCQIGLDGIRMLEPSTSRILRIYPLETVERFEVYDSSTFAFWSKSPVDIEPKRIRLQSNSYTTNTILDIVTAATVQLKEIGGINKPSDSSKPTEQPSEKKKGLGDWMNLIKPANEEKDHWVPDEAVSKCTGCGNDFSAFVRKHHCRNCGDIFCDKCTQGRIALTAEENAQPVRVCSRCMVEVTRRLNIAKEAASKSKVLQSHEDLAKKIQEEMERNRKSTSGSKSDGSGRRMKEVACPICTVHLQVQVPSSGSETIECGVCQHPFLVSAR